jgi:hypothetical protein
MAIQINIRDVPERVRDELAARAALQGKRRPLATLDVPLSKSNGVTCRFRTPGF